MNERRDDLDQLYERLEWENPRAQFTARVLARVRQAERHMQRVERISAALSLLALLALGVFGFALGRGLSVSGALDYLMLLVTNLDVALDEADLFAQALAYVIPWNEALAVAGAMLALWLASFALPRLLSRWPTRSS